MLLNYGVGKDSWESFGLQGDPTSQSWEKSILNTHWKDWCWSWSSYILATWCEELTHEKNPCCWKRLKARGEGDNRGWDGWTVSATQWTWAWASSGSWRWTGKPGMLQSVGLQRIRQDRATELNWPIHPSIYLSIFVYTHTCITHIHSYNGIICYSSMRACLVVQLCPILWDFMDCSLPRFNVHGIFQSRILECISISYSRDLPDLAIELTSLASLAWSDGYHSNTWETPVKYKSFIFIQ